METDLWRVIGSGEGDRFDDEEDVFAFNLRSALADRILPTSFLKEFPIAFPTVFFFGGDVWVDRGIVGVDGGELKRVFW